LVPYRPLPQPERHRAGGEVGGLVQGLPHTRENCLRRWSGKADWWFLQTPTSPEGELQSERGGEVKADWFLQNLPHTEGTEQRW
jgi:hypothetical protein